MTTTTPSYRRARKPPPCPCGKCSGERGICESHRELLARFRQELFGTGGRFNMRSDQRGYRDPTCTAVGCLNSRKPPTPYCESCLEESE